MIPDQHNKPSQAGQVRTQIQSQFQKPMSASRSAHPSQPSHHPSQLPQQPSFDRQSVQLPQQVVSVAAEQYSIAALERKMMFLHEPQIQGSITKSMQSKEKGDLIKHIWRVHAKQMANTAQEQEGSGRRLRKKSVEDTFPEPPDDSPPYHPQLITGFAQSQPRDFDRFQKQVLQYLSQLRDQYHSLRKKFTNKGNELDLDLQRIDGMTTCLQQTFDDFCALYNSYQQREENLNQLHAQAIKRAQDLTKRMNFEVVSASSQRAQLLSIIDDLNTKLKKAKAQIPDSEILASTQQLLNETKLKCTQQASRITDQDRQLQSYKVNLEKLTQTYNQCSEELEQNRHSLATLKTTCQQQASELLDTKSALDTALKSSLKLKMQYETTVHVKDKIILGLQQAAQPSLN